MNSYTYSAQCHLVPSELSALCDSLLVARYDGADSFGGYAFSHVSVRRYGIIAAEADGTEEFGLVDNLTFAYEGNQVQSIANAPEGEDFYGRTGYSAAEGESTYAWNERGYMTADSSRGIYLIKYNHQGLSVQTRFSNGDLMVCNYDASGLLTQAVTLGRSFALRDYVADRVLLQLTTSLYSVLME